MSIAIKLSLIIEGATEKVSQFTIPMKPIYNKNFFVLINKNVIFEKWRKG